MSTPICQNVKRFKKPPNLADPPTVANKIDCKNLLGLILACVSPESFKKNINFIDHWLEYGANSNSSFDSLIDKASDDEPLISSPIGDDDPFFILYTGGTTGISKGA